ncbi:hypothetical protein [Moorella sp. Hama-1]|uniref:hypothetical protein n=1 Tax=Moorella sp. Hama-1 TaxID=2138101 RepID=UPI001912E0CA|nr:hypothetical protein [Moorella sp. Hama-1]BCV22592.1 hypothetical protein hamaS1_26610 [Moorella sp. Hama-1]
MDDILKTIVARIKRTADPDKIILFGSRIGSRSRGKKTDSDYDLLILKKVLLAGALSLNSFTGS